MSTGWETWARRRVEFRGLHLDSAAAGRSSQAVLSAVSEHAADEAATGGYVAQAAAAPVIEQGRVRLAALLGLPTDGLGFVGSGTGGLQTLLEAWPLKQGDTVAVARSEWGPNLHAYAARGLRVIELACDRVGHVDLEALARTLRERPPTVLALTHVAAHSGVVQPVHDVAALCREHNVAFWVDSAQALGHVDTACGADAVWATSRKWLTGPRGVGVLGVAPRWWSSLRLHRPPMTPDGEAPMRWLDYVEGHIAGRVGLAAAVGECVADSAEALCNRLRQVGEMTREVLGGVRRWEVVPGSTSAITALRPLDGKVPAEVRATLLARHGILTTASQPVRAPLDPIGPTLRISPHVDCTADMLDRLADALATV